MLTFSGLSKAYRVCGFRSGWMAISGPKHLAKDYLEGINLLTNMRLCANVPGQLAIEQALHGQDTISALCAPGGRLHETRSALIDSCAASRHLSLVAPGGAMYGFPSVAGAAARGFDDHAFALELLETEDVLVVPGSGFNAGNRLHFRVTLLPQADVLRDVFARIERLLDRRLARGANAGEVDTDARMATVA